MAFWQSASIVGINEGLVPDDGTGDSIRNAFIKVGGNFSNISGYLSSDSIDFVNANVELKLIAGQLIAGNITGNNATISTLVVENLISASGHSTGTTNTNDLNVTGNAIVLGQTDLQGITVLHNNIVPSANLRYDLGSPTNFFRNIYSQGLVQVNSVTASSDAGILSIHSNLTPGDIKDLGIQAKYNQTGSNNYAFFGFQHSTDNFVYIQTPIDTSGGNSIVSGGIYGNAHFGSAWVSNITSATSTSTGALVVSGGAGIAGNLYAGSLNTPTAAINNITGNLSVTGNLTSGGFPVLTTSNLSSFGSAPAFNGGIVSGSVLFLSSQQSFATNSGAVTIPFGGLGVGGNVTAGGLVGNILTSNQPGITGLGTLSSLTVAGAMSTGSIQATSMGATTATLTNLSVTNTITGSVSGNAGTATKLFTARNISGIAFDGTQNITLTTTGITEGTNLYYTDARAQAAVTTISGNAGTATKLQTARNINGVSFDGTSDITVHTSSGSGNVSISGTSITLTPTGPGATTIGGSGSIPIITTDAYGRVVGMSSASISVPSSTITLTGTLGTGTVSTGGTLTFAGSQGMKVSASGGTITVDSPQDLQTTASPAFVGLNLSGTATVANITTTGGVFWSNGSAYSSSNFKYTVSATAPSSPNLGDQWYNTTNNVLYEYVSDGSNRIWVDTTGPVTSTVGFNDVIPTANVSYNLGAVSTWWNNAYVNNLTTNNITGTLSTASQPNITSVGTLSGLTVSNSIVPSANVSVNLGSATQWFNNIYGTAIHAQYADLAENYASDARYAPGTVVVFGGSAEVTVTDQSHDRRVAGVVSSSPAYLMNSESPGIPIALTGKVPCSVLGPVCKGDGLVTSSHSGAAEKLNDALFKPGVMIGKSLEDHADPVIKTIMISIGRF